MSFADILSNLQLTVEDILNHLAIDWKSFQKQNFGIIIDHHRLCNLLHVRCNSPEQFARTLPFSVTDTTVGVENELQVAVTGAQDRVDLPLTIQSSSYYKNMLIRLRRGEVPHSVVSVLEQFLDENSESIWENSWVRFPRRCLTPFANQVFENDLKSDKSQPESPQRSDVDRFLFFQQQEEFLRIPVSYLLKLALADVISRPPAIPALLRNTGERLMRHFLNDNTSPETYSFYPVPLNQNGPAGLGIAAETLKRFLLTHLLICHANTFFDLAACGQKASIYFAPHPPIRQKLLNDLISDTFYRDLFLSPCLSGWDQGQVKYAYMELCHQVLSRSQLNAVVKLRDAGILNTNLVVLPNISNTSLANNGTHISLGSVRLASCLKNSASGFTALEEKYLGDLAIKIMEHFLPLFVGTYSAAPYRLDFADFHPEKVLGFLPHELDFTHLRMIWRRWKKKADLKILGQAITPFGLNWLDRGISRIFGLKGDFVPDFRLLDYLVALLSTDTSPGLDGTLNNDLRLKQDLQAMGVFDSGIALYQLYRLRKFSVMGYSGFEGRYYSQFSSLIQDMAPAAALQNLLTALCFKYILSGKVKHNDIPDTPSVESERRQIFFGAAIDLPTFFVHQQTTNHFLRNILAQVKKTRISRRYPNHIRVHHAAWRQALLDIIRKDAADLIEMMNLEPVIQDLAQRLKDPYGFAVSGKLLKGIMDQAGTSDPLKLPAETFNIAAESYYRKNLRQKYLDEALTLLIDDLEAKIQQGQLEDRLFQNIFNDTLNNDAPTTFLKSCRTALCQDSLTPEVTQTMICLTLLSVTTDDMPQYVR
jgi:hypothetical protein